MAAETQKILHSPSKINKMFKDAQAHFDLAAKQATNEEILKKRKQGEEEKNKAKETDVEMVIEGRDFEDLR